MDETSIVVLVAVLVTFLMSMAFFLIIKTTRMAIKKEGGIEEPFKAPLPTLTPELKMAAKVYSIQRHSILEGTNAPKDSPKVILNPYV